MSRSRHPQLALGWRWRGRHDVPHRGAMARRYLYIANPYFIPDFRAIDMLARACRRGVTVKLMLAGEHNDTWWARQNSVRLYGKLLLAGVETYEYQPTMLHQKTMVVDGVWPRSALRISIIVRSL